MEKLIVRSLVLLMFVFSAKAQAQSDWASRAWKSDLENHPIRQEDPGAHRALLMVAEKLGYQPQVGFWEDQHKMNRLLQIPQMVQNHGLNPADYNIESIINNPNLHGFEKEFQLMLELITIAFDISTGRVDPKQVDDNMKTDYRRQYGESHRTYRDGRHHIMFEKKQGLSDYQISQVAKLLQNPSQQVLDELAPRYEDYVNLQAVLASGRRLTADQRKKIILSMEKLRWLPDVPPQGNRYLMVNTSLNMMNNYDYTLPMSSPLKRQRVITGQTELAGKKTISMADTIHNVIINPLWRVDPGRGIWRGKVKSMREIYTNAMPAAPVSEPGQNLMNAELAETSLAPTAPVMNAGMQAVMNYLARNQYDITTPDFNTILPANSINWGDPNIINNVNFTFVQNPWRGNAVGTIKYSLMGKGAQRLIYLHDTGNRGLFNNDKFNRNKSSGCIRVHKYAELAEYLLSDKGWTADSIQEEISKAIPELVTHTEGLNRGVGRLPVFVLHLNAQVTNGTIEYGRDRYKEDRALERALQQNNFNL